MAAMALWLACAGGAAAEPLRLAHQFREAGSAGRAAADLAAAVADGGIDIRVIPDGRLGDATANLRQIATGELDLTIGGSLAIGYLSPEYRALLIPFLVDQPRDMLTILEGPIGQEMTAGWAEKYNLVVLGWFYASPRIIAATRPLPDADALKGLKLRVGGADAWIDFFLRTGAQVSVRLLLEIDAAARAGMIDAVDLPAEAILNNAYGRALPHVAWTRHHYETMFIGVSASLLAGLPLDQRDLLMRQAAVAAQRATQRDQDADAALRARLAGNGFAVTAFDPAPLRPYVDRVAETLSGGHGPALVARVRAQLGR